MKKKSIALIATLALALSMTACGGKETSNSAEQTSTNSAQESTVIESNEDSNALPYTVEIVYPDPSFESLTKEEFDAAVKHHKDTNNYHNSSFPYATITNTSDEAYCISYYTGQNTIIDYYFEPEEVLFCQLHYVIDENGIYTWAAPETITTSSANENRDTVRGSITVNFADSRMGEHGFWNLTSVELPVIRNPHLDYLTLCHINYYDAEGNIIATDGCSNHPIDSTDNEGIDLHVEPRINAPKSITWDHLEVFWMYTLPDYSAG